MALTIQIVRGRLALCDEEGAPFRGQRDVKITQEMGQPPIAVVTLIVDGRHGVVLGADKAAPSEE